MEMNGRIHTTEKLSNVIILASGSRLRQGAGTPRKERSIVTTLFDGNATL